MQSVVGIFANRTAAEQAANELMTRGIPSRSIVFLTGMSGQNQIEDLSTTDAEPEGMGKAVGALVGGAAGIGAGLSLGSAAASLFVPGVGAIVAVGLGAAAMLGVGAATAGAAIGDASEHSLDIGVPKDEVFFYRSLLRNGKSIVIANVETDDHAQLAQDVFAQLGGEDVDAARKEMRNAA
jgi:hypothetical protein